MEKLPPHKYQPNISPRRDPAPRNRPTWGSSLACASVFFSFASLSAAQVVSPLLWATGGALAAAALLRFNGEQQHGEGGLLVCTFSVIGLLLCAAGMCATIFW